MLSFFTVELNSTSSNAVIKNVVEIFKFFRDDKAMATSLTFLTTSLVTAAISYIWFVLQYSDMIR